MRDSHIGHRIPVEALEHSRWFYVYHLYDEVGELLYIGQTADVYTRWMQHRRLRSWGREIAFVEVQRFAYLDLALAAERAAITRDKPIHNVRLTEQDNAYLGGRLAAARKEKREAGGECVSNADAMPTAHATNGTDGRTHSLRALPPTSAHDALVTRAISGDERRLR